METFPGSMPPENQNTLPLPPEATPALSPVVLPENNVVVGPDGHVFDLSHTGTKAMDIVAEKPDTVSFAGVDAKEPTSMPEAKEMGVPLELSVALGAIALSGIAVNLTRRGRAATRTAAEATGRAARTAAEVTGRAARETGGDALAYTRVASLGFRARRAQRKADRADRRHDRVDGDLEYRRTTEQAITSRVTEQTPGGENYSYNPLKGFSSSRERKIYGSDRSQNSVSGGRTQNSSKGPGKAPEYLEKMGNPATSARTRTQERSSKRSNRRFNKQARQGRTLRELNETWGIDFSDHNQVDSLLNRTRSRKTRKAIRSAAGNYRRTLSGGVIARRLPEVVRHNITGNGDALKHRQDRKADGRDLGGRLQTLRIDRADNEAGKQTNRAIRLEAARQAERNHLALRKQARRAARAARRAARRTTP